MVKVLIKIENSYPANRKVIRKAIIETLSLHKVFVNVNSEVSVVVVGDKKMDELSLKFLKDGQRHEVLSFPSEDLDTKSGFANSPDGIARLGDIVLCWPQVLLAADRDGVIVDEAVYRLTSHAVEHLLGKHHD